MVDGAVEGDVGEGDDEGGLSGVGHGGDDYREAGAVGEVEFGVIAL